LAVPSAEFVGFGECGPDPLDRQVEIAVVDQPDQRRPGKMIVFGDDLACQRPVRAHRNSSRCVTSVTTIVPHPSDRSAVLAGGPKRGTGRRSTGSRMVRYRLYGLIRTKRRDHSVT